jgi:hypothetical protein
MRAEMGLKRWREGKKVEEVERKGEKKMVDEM